MILVMDGVSYLQRNVHLQYCTGETRVLFALYFLLHLTKMQVSPTNRELELDKCQLVIC